MSFLYDYSQPTWKSADFQWNCFHATLSMWTTTEKIHVKTVRVCGMFTCPTTRAIVFASLFCSVLHYTRIKYGCVCVQFWWFEAQCVEREKERVRKRVCVIVLNTCHGYISMWFGCLCINLKLVMQKNIYVQNKCRKKTIKKRFASGRWKIDLSHYYTARRQVFSSLSVWTIPLSTTHSPSDDVLVLATLWCRVPLLLCRLLFTHTLLLRLLYFFNKQFDIDRMRCLH